MDSPDSEVLIEGWMVKSPPQKRSVHGYPLIRKKWRRRWFVLEQGKLPGQYILNYYTDSDKKRMKGSICLDECEQVDIGLKDENGKYDFMFNIRTPKRTYYLAVECEDEMNTWVTHICEVVGLKSSVDDENAQPSGVASAGPSSSSGTRPRSATTTSGSGSRQAISSPYIHIADCYSGSRVAPKPEEKKSIFQTRSVSNGNLDRRQESRNFDSELHHQCTDDEDDSVFVDSSPPKLPAPRPPWGVPVTPRGPTVDPDETVLTSLSLCPRTELTEKPPKRPPKPSHLSGARASAKESCASVENYENSTEMQEVFRVESNNNVSSLGSLLSVRPGQGSGRQPPVSRNLKPFRKFHGSVTLSGPPKGPGSSSRSPATNCSTVGRPRDRSQISKTPVMSTMPRLPMSQRTRPFLSTENLDTSDDWIHSDEVKIDSDDEQIYFYMPPASAVSSFGGSSIPLMIPANSFEHPSVSYIDLDLPETDDCDPVPKVVHDESNTIYKTIDIEKTDAFNRTKKDRENQRQKIDSQTR